MNKTARIAGVGLRRCVFEAKSPVKAAHHGRLEGGSQEDVARMVIHMHCDSRVFPGT